MTGGKTPRLNQFRRGRKHQLIKSRSGGMMIFAGNNPLHATLKSLTSNAPNRPLTAKATPLPNRLANRAALRPRAVHPVPRPCRTVAAGAAAEVDGADGACPRGIAATRVAGAGATTAPHFPARTRAVARNNTASTVPLNGTETWGMKALAPNRQGGPSPLTVHCWAISVPRSNACAKCSKGFCAILRTSPLNSPKPSTKKIYPKRKSSNSAINCGVCTANFFPQRLQTPAPPAHARFRPAGRETSRKVARR